MAYFIDLFSPETYEAFSRSDRAISGFRKRHAIAALRVKPGDKLVCYLTKLSRWVGLLEVIEGPFEDGSPIFYAENDPFVIRFRVQPVIWLPVEKAVPIHDERIWNHLSFTRNQPRGSVTWTGKVRSSLVQLDDGDGRHIEAILGQQAEGGVTYPIDEVAYRKLVVHRVRRADKEIAVTVPEDTEPEVSEEGLRDIRESTTIQALLAEIGSRMGMSIWIPRNNRAAVTNEWEGDPPRLLDRLPLNYDETTLKTIEQIDVLWLKGRAIRRAFEVEHTTSVYSGILRMADLLALQPNMDIRLHIVAPSARRDKVFQELTRPVFSLLEKGPLSDYCTYLSYESVRELARLPHLPYLSDSVVEEYAEEPD